MVAPQKRAGLSKQILQQIDSRDEKVMVIKATPTAAPRSYTGNVPFWQIDLHEVASPDAAEPDGEPLLVAEMDRMRLKITRRKAPMTYTRRHVDADEVFFVHRGGARFLTEIGEIDAPTGRFIYLSRGVGYRVVPTTDDFLALIFESEEAVQLSDECDMVELPLVLPSFSPSLPASGGQEEWEERIVARDWTASAIREFDPIATQKVVGEAKLAFGIDISRVPTRSPKVPAAENSGYPFALFESPVMGWDISKRTVALPFYHRNNRRNELEFVHLGVGDQDTDLGYLSAPAGTLYNLPRGVEHSPCNRIDPQVCLIWETDSEVRINPDLWTTDQSA
ncbi:MAG: hypothetical protein O7B81_07060 [Gammaproteobacteria bacterium]|nr:hypothetical protein [Gammaproteobacteria bacterium]